MLPELLVVDEPAPVFDLVGVSDQHRHRHLLGCTGLLEQFQPRLVRQFVALLRVDLLAGPNEVVPCVAPATGARNDVVDIPLVVSQDLARVLFTERSCSRIGSVIHSDHRTGRIDPSPSMSSAVATPDANWQ